MELYILHWALINENIELSIDCKVFDNIQDADKKVNSLVYEWMENNSCDAKVERFGNSIRVQSKDDYRELNMHIEEYKTEDKL